MQIREFLQKHPSAAVALIIIVILASLLIARRSGPSIPSNAAYFYDLNNAQLFVGTGDQIAPVQAPEGGPDRGVRAYVYTCGACGEGERFIAYLEKYTNDAKSAVKAADPSQTYSAQTLTAIQQGTLIALPPESNNQDPQWVPSASSRGLQIVAAKQTQCDGQPARQCYP